MKSPLWAYQAFFLFALFLSTPVWGSTSRVTTFLRYSPLLGKSVARATSFGVRLCTTSTSDDYATTQFRADMEKRFGEAIEKLLIRMTSEIFSTAEYDEDAPVVTSTIPFWVGGQVRLRTTTSSSQSITLPPHECSREADGIIDTIRESYRRTIRALYFQARRHHEEYCKDPEKMYSVMCEALEKVCAHYKKIRSEEAQYWHAGTSSDTVTDQLKRAACVLTQISQNTPSSRTLDDVFAQVMVRHAADLCDALSEYVDHMHSWTESLLESVHTE